MEGVPTRYDGEDNRTTSKREFWGCYSYGLAAEVFTICGVGKTFSLAYVEAVVV